MVLVDNLVVDQGGRVQHFNYRTQLNSHPVVAAAREPGTQKQQRRAQTLFTVPLQVSRNGRYGVDGRVRFDMNCFFHAAQIFTHEIEDRIRCQDLSRAPDFHWKNLRH
jgi:hypothetical protein